MAITPPAFCKDAVPSLKGWHHPKTNELLKSTRHTQVQIDEFNGVSVAPPVSLKVVCPTCDEDGNCTCEPTDGNLEDMTKKELEEYARENLDVELDRRSSKKKLLDQVTSLINK